MMWRAIRPFAEAGVIIGISYLLGLASNYLDVFLVFGILIASWFLLYVDKHHTHGLILLSFCIPFERIGSVDISGVTIRPSQLIALTLCLVGTEMLLRKKIHYAQTPHLLFLTLFFVLGAWSLLNALNIERSLLVYLFTLFTCATSVIIPQFVRTEHDLRRVLSAGFAAYIVVVLFGLYQWAGDWIGLPPALTGLRELYTKEILGFPRLQSTALEPLYFANYLLIPLSILTSYFLSKKSPLPLPRLILVLGLGYLALLLTVARGGYIAFALALCVLALFHIRTLVQPHTIALALIGASFAGIALLTLADGEVIAQALSHVTNLFVGASFNERVHMYTIAFKAFAEHPWLGIGPGGFGPFASAHPYIVPHDGWNIVNNEYLELLAENGILGLLSMLAVFAIVSIRSVAAIVRTQDTFLRSTLIGCLAAFIGILVQYNTFSILYIMHIWFLIGCMIAMQNIIFTKQR